MASMARRERVEALEQDVDGLARRPPRRWRSSSKTSSIWW
jgi:hypothetical protein